MLTILTGYPEKLQRPSELRSLKLEFTPVPPWWETEAAALPGKARLMIAHPDNRTAVSPKIAGQLGRRMANSQAS